MEPPKRRSGKNRESKCQSAPVRTDKGRPSCGGVKKDNSLVTLYNLEKVCERFEQKKKNLNFDELISAAQKAKFELKQKSTSHYVARHPTHTMPPLQYNLLNFQEKNGQAKCYQVEQFLNFIQHAQPKGKKNE